MPAKADAKPAAKKSKPTALAKKMQGMSSRKVTKGETADFLADATAAAAPYLTAGLFSSLERRLKKDDPKAARDVADILMMRPQRNNVSSIIIAQMLAAGNGQSEKRSAEGPSTGLFDMISRQLDQPRTDQRGEIPVVIEGKILSAGDEPEE